MKINFNQIVRVKFTENGRNILKSHYDENRRIIRSSDLDEGIKSEIFDLINEREGSEEFPLWQLFAIFGEHTYHGCDAFFEDNNIEILKGDK